jgi:hypothetical protein
MVKIHIGKKIKEIVDKSPFTVVAFAKSINLSRGGANNIFKKETIAAAQLQKISEVLNHDFFAYYSNNLSLAKEHKNPYGYATKEEVLEIAKTLLVLTREFEKFRQEFPIKPPRKTIKKK